MIQFTNFNCSWMMSPITVDRFIDQHWGQSTLLVKRTGHYFSPLFSEHELEFALHAACRTGANVDILRSEERGIPCVNHAQTIASFRGGASLRVNAIQTFLPKLAALSRNLQQDLSCGVNINMYLTPGGRQALRRHFDTHDVFVLQISGDKIWRIYDKPVDNPLENVPVLWSESIHEMRVNRLNESIDPPSDQSIERELTLEPGDLLYLPRGFWHEAFSKPDEVSCHLTVGLQTLPILIYCRWLLPMSRRRNRVSVIACRLGFQGRESAAH